MAAKRLVLDANILVRAVLGVRARGLLEREGGFARVPFYADREAQARARPADPEDWPVLACALVLDCPIWTEDRDFFGTGVATWTSDRVEIYLSGQTQASTFPFLTDHGDVSPSRPGLTRTDNEPRDGDEN